jgi:hypothetical protein
MHKTPTKLFKKAHTLPSLPSQVQKVNKLLENRLTSFEKV